MTAIDESGQVSLSPMQERDVLFAYQLATDLEAEWPRIYESGPLGPHLFGDTLWRGVAAMFVARVDRGPVGVAGLYEVDYRHGVGWVEVVLSRRTPQAPFARSTTAASLIDSAFDQFGLRKVFCWHLGCHEPPLGGIAVEEARLEKSVLHDGWYWDRVITSVTAREREAAST